MPKKKENLSLEEKLQKVIIPKEEEPYIIPDNWMWTRLGNITDINMGQSPSGESVTKEFSENSFGLIGGPSDMGNNFPIISRYTTTPTKLSEEGEVILSIRATLGKTIFSDGKYCLGRGVCSLKSKIIDRNILRFYLTNITEYLYSIGTGSTFLQISKSDIENILFPLPPLEEQKRIVEKLDSLFEKTQKIKEIIEEVKEKTISRREAILSRAFTGELTEKWRSENETSSAEELLYKINNEKIRIWEEECEKAEEEGRKKPSKPQIKDISEMLVKEDEIPYKVPDNWIWTRLGDITNYGEVKQVKAENISENAWILELEDIEKGTSKILKKVLKKERKNKSNKHIFLRGSILYSKLRPYLNKILIAEEDGYATTEIIPFNGLVDVNNKYIFYYFIFPKTIETINFLTHGMQMPRLGTDKAKKLLFPLPPLEEQKEIVRILDKVFEKEDKISELLLLEEKVEALEKIILDRAFRGELGTGNIEDEPAIEMLKKLLETK